MTCLPGPGAHAKPTRSMAPRPEQECPLSTRREQQNGRIHLIPYQSVPGQAALQFYGDKAEVVCTAPTAPTSPTCVPVK